MSLQMDPSFGWQSETKRKQHISHAPFGSAFFWRVFLLGCFKGNQKEPTPSLSTILGVPSPLFPGILLSTKPPKTLGKQLVLAKNNG